MSRSINRLLILFAVLFGLPICANAQLLSQGNEINVSYSPPNAVLATQAPALNFSVTTGLNTFLMNVNPTVSARVYITNDTANACIGVFSVSLAAASSNSTTSFNNQLQNWQSIPLINSSGALVNSTLVDIGANATAYISSTAISSPRLALQIVNTTGSCATTTLDVNVVFTSVSVTSPLISVTANGSTGSGVTANVQGIVAAGANGVPVNPVIAGALQPATNALFLAAGIDTFSQAQFPTLDGTNSQRFIYGFTPPAPSVSGEWGLAFFVGGFTNTPSGLNAPWLCVEVTCVNNSAPNTAALSLGNNSAGSLTPFTTFTGSSIQYNMEAAFVLFKKQPTIRQHTVFNTTTTVAPPGNTLAGSTLIMAVSCNAAPCGVSSVSDTQGLTWRLIQQQSSSVAVTTGGGGISVWVASGTTAAADTITPVMSGTTMNGASILELTSITPGSLNQASAPFLSDANKAIVTGGNLAGITDPCQAAAAQKQSVVINITSATTTQLVALISGQSVYVCGFNAATVAGTFTLEYGTGASCGTGTTTLTGAYPAGNISYGGAAQSVLKPTPAGNALCALTGAGLTNAQGVLTYVQQ